VVFPTRRSASTIAVIWLSGGGEISSSQEFLYHSTLLVSDDANDSVHLFDSHHGHFSKTLIKPGAGGLKSPQGIQFGSDNNIYVASAGTNQILKFNVNGQALGVFSELPKTCYPTDIVFGPDSNLFVSCTGMGKVIALNANSGQQLGTAAQGGGLSQPMGITFGPGNTLYVVSMGTNQIMRYAQGGYFQGTVARTEDRGSGIAMNGGFLYLTGGHSVENAVLVLTDENFDHALSKFPVLCVNFFNLGHGASTEFAPTYSKAARKLLKELGERKVNLEDEKALRCPKHCRPHEDNLSDAQVTVSKLEYPLWSTSCSPSAQSRRNLSSAGILRQRLARTYR